MKLVTKFELINLASLLLFTVIQTYSPRTRKGVLAGYRASSRKWLGKKRIITKLNRLPGCKDRKKAEMILLSQTKETLGKHYWNNFG